MTSSWTHPICDGCYKFETEMDPSMPEKPVRLTNPTFEKCCFCGESTLGSGIYIRRDPRGLQCRGKHEEESAA